MVPVVGSRNLVIRLKQVVLPAPLGPIRACMVPRRTLRLTFLTAVKPRKSLVNPLVWSTYSLAIKLSQPGRECALWHYCAWPSLSTSPMGAGGWRAGARPPAYVAARAGESPQAQASTLQIGHEAQPKPACRGPTSWCAQGRTRRPSALGGSLSRLIGPRDAIL